MTSSQSQLVREVENLKKSTDRKTKCSKKLSSPSESMPAHSEGGLCGLAERSPLYTFADRMADTMKRLQLEWWAAVENVLDTAKSELFFKEVEANKLKLNKQLDTAKKAVFALAFDQLQHDLESFPGLKMTLKVNVRSGNIACEGEEECLEAPKTYVEVFKVDDVEDVGRSSPRISRLGQFDLKPDENVLRLFTIKTKSLLMVSTFRDRMFVHSVNFQSTRGARHRQKTMLTQCKVLGKIASLCDFDASNRLMAFLVGETIRVFKFDEHFRSMENIQKIDLSARSTLVYPFVGLLLYDHTLTLTDGHGRSQTIHLHSQQTSTEVNIVVDDDHEAIAKSQLFPLGDGLIVGCFVLSKSQTEDDAYDGRIQSVSCDDHRSLPSLLLPPQFLCDRIQAVCIGEKLVAFDPVANRIYVMFLKVTVRSESYRIRQSSGKNPESNIAGGMKQDDTKHGEHWMWAFYHGFEKFPVRGFLDTQVEGQIRVMMSYPERFCDRDSTPLSENCGRYLDLIMKDLDELNKSLYGMMLSDFAKIDPNLNLSNLRSQSLQTMLRTLVTFVPIQICRAEANTLKVMSNGMMVSWDPDEELMQNYNSVSIAQNMRFGLLSPLLSSWQGRCIVVTSMGKQSTGKSYFLNHLTGSSFAISGARCTDGAWMTVRVLPDNVLLVVIDFEGLGSLFSEWKCVLTKKSMSFSRSFKREYTF